MNEPGRNISVLSKAEQVSLLSQPNPKAPTGLRNLCMIRLMLEAGMRVNEIINLKEKDLDWNNCSVHIAESGAARGRELWLDQELVKLLKEWSLGRKGSSEYLFTTLKNGRLKDRYIREMIKRLAIKAGISPDVHPHLLRRTFACELLRETNDLGLLQEALGHRDITTTRKYLNYQTCNLRQEVVGEKAALRRCGVPVKLSGPEGGNIDPATDLAGSQDKKGEQDQLKGSISGSKKVISESVTTGEKELDEDLIITVIAEDAAGKMKVMPAIKCSKCDYILHYQSDCPKCSTTFLEILRHWGRDV